MEPAAEPVRRPWWLVLFFAVEAGGWLLQAALELVFASAIGRAGLGPQLAFLLAQALATLLATGLFVVGIARPIRRSTLRRFATVHIAAATVVTLPVLGALVRDAARQLGEGRWGLAWRDAGLILVLLAVPAVALAASRRDETRVLAVASLIGVLWVCLGALAVLSAAVGFGGVTV